MMSDLRYDMLMDLIADLWPHVDPSDVLMGVWLSLLPDGKIVIVRDRMESDDDDAGAVLAFIPVLGASD